MSRSLFVSGALCVLVLSASSAGAQTTTYHLHNEASSTAGFLQLKTAGPVSDLPKFLPHSRMKLVD
jgi:hypothetical protein